MSNRNKWAHWNKPKREKHPLRTRLLIGSGLTILGGLLILSGVEGIHDHVLWFTQFNPRSGSFGVVETTTLFVWGGIFLVAGLTILIVHDY
jgi:hypothetical protein